MNTERSYMNAPCRRRQIVSVMDEPVTNEQDHAQGETMIPE